ncbi:hypothetical protein DXG01_001977 [Tephrocybe rancida]|nr:hypothetical protein DXG01_001977 [Tephrocybe rancida]
MALSVSGFPEPLRQLDTDDSSFNPLQRGLSLFAKKRQNTDDTLPDSVPESSPISTISSADEFAQMAILQPPPIIPPSLTPRPRQVSLTRRTPPPQQRQPSLGRLEIGSLPNRPSLPKPPSVVQPHHEAQTPSMAHPRPLPAPPASITQGPIVESSKSAAMRAAAAAPPTLVQPQPRPPPSRVILAGSSRPRAHTTVPQTVGVRYQSMAVDPTESPGTSSSLSSSSAPAPVPAPPPVLPPTPQAAPPTAATPGLGGPRPLPRIPPVSVSVAPVIASPAPIPAAPLSAAVLSSHLQPPYVPRPPRVKRPKTSPSSSAGFTSAVRSPFDAVPTSWASRPVDLHPTSPSGSSSASTSNAYASGSGSNVHASGSGSNANASGSGASSSGSSSGSAPRSLPRPRSHSRTRDQSAEASGSRSRGATSPIRRAPLASGSNSAPLPSSSGSGSGLGGPITPPGSRRGSSASNPPTPRTSVSASVITNGNRSPRASPRIPSLPPVKIISRALPPAKIIEEPAITSVSRITVTTRSASHTPPPSSPRSQSVGHPTSILKNSKTRTKRTLTLHSAPPEPSSSPLKKPLLETDMDVDVDADAEKAMGIIAGASDGASHLSRTPSPIHYARPSSRESLLLSSDDDAHPKLRSRPRDRSQLRSFRRSYRPKPLERSPSPIAYAKRSSVDLSGAEPEMIYDDEDVDDEMDFGVSSKHKQRRHTQPRSYQFEYRGPAEDPEKEKEKEKEKAWKDLRRKGSKEGKENKEGTWDAVWKTAVGSTIVRKRSKSKASSSQTASKDSGSGTATGTPTGSVIDITSPVPYVREFTPNYSNPSLHSRESGEQSLSSHTSSGSGRPGSAKKPRRKATSATIYSASAFTYL